MPTGTAPGGYRLIACADAGKRVKESNEHATTAAAAKAFRVAFGLGGEAPIMPPRQQRIEIW